jgi:hypothetical protein
MGPEDDVAVGEDLAKTETSETGSSSSFEDEKVTKH